MIKVSQVLNRKMQEEYLGIIKKTTFKGNKKEVKIYSKPISYNYESKNQYNKHDLETEKNKQELYDNLGLKDRTEHQKKEQAKKRRITKIGRFYQEQFSLIEKLNKEQEYQQLYDLLPDELLETEHIEDISDLYLDDNKFIAYKFQKFLESKTIKQSYLTDTEQLTNTWDDVATIYQRNELKAIYSILGDIKLNTDMRAIKNIKNLLDCNVGQYKEVDKWITLTYSDEYYEHSKNREQVKKDLRAFIQRLNRKFNTKVEYLCVLEIQHKRMEKYGTKNWHLHIALFNCPYLPIKENSIKIKELKNNENQTYKIKQQIKKLERENAKFWKFGTFDIEGLKNSNLSEYLTKYVSKDFAFREFDPKFNSGHRYFRSNGLYKPLEVLNSQVEDFKIFNDRYYVEKIHNYQNYDKTTEIEMTKLGLDENKISKSRRKITDSLINQFQEFLDVSLETEQLTKIENEAVVKTAQEIDNLKHQIEYYEKYENVHVKNEIQEIINKTNLNDEEKKQLNIILSCASLNVDNLIKQMLEKCYLLNDKKYKLKNNITDQILKVVDKIEKALIFIKTEYNYYTKFKMQSHYEQQNILITNLKLNYQKIKIESQLEVEKMIVRTRHELNKQFNPEIIENQHEQLMKKKLEYSIRKNNILYVRKM